MQACKRYIVNAHQVMHSLVLRHRTPNRDALCVFVCVHIQGTTAFNFEESPLIHRGQKRLSPGQMVS